jgi:UDP-N-acetyl-D-mannosaminuronic acid transferase (WecB/TagA/CpsF family)
MKYRLCEEESPNYNAVYAQALRTWDFLLPDGIALQIFAKVGRFVDRWPHNLNGTDLIPKLLAYLTKQWTVSVYLYSVYDPAIEKGEEWLQQAANILSHNYGVQVQAMYQEHYQQRGNAFPWKERWAIADADGSDYKVRIHGTWTPFQEERIVKNYDLLRQRFGGIHLAAWGFLDFVSGFERRAPQRVVAARVLETPRRIITQPKKNLKKFLVMFWIIRYWWSFIRCKRNALRTLRRKS